MNQSSDYLAPLAYMIQEEESTLEIIKHEKPHNLSFIPGDKFSQPIEYITKYQKKHNLTLISPESLDYEDKLTALYDRKLVEQTTNKIINNKTLTKYLLSQSFGNPQIIQKPVNSLINIGSLQPNVSPSTSLWDSFDKVIQPEDLAEMSLPVIDFIKDVQPHLVVGCDRGGRMFSLAVHSAWQKTSDGAPFPTLDGKIHFARISKTENEEVLQMRFDEMVAQAKAQARVSGTPLPDNEQLRVLFIDDWVAGGGTKALTERLAGKHGAKSYFAVMRGNKADVSGMPDEEWAKPDWSDNGNAMGINYVTAVIEGQDGVLYETQKPMALRSEAALSNRRRLQAAVRKLELIPDALAA